MDSKQAIFPSAALTPRSPLDAMAPQSGDKSLLSLPPAVGLPQLKAQIASLESNRQDELAKAEQAQIAVHKIDGALHVLRFLAADAESRSFKIAEEANRQAAARAQG